MYSLYKIYSYKTAKGALYVRVNRNTPEKINQMLNFLSRIPRFISLRQYTKAQRTLSAFFNTNLYVFFINKRVLNLHNTFIVDNHENT